MQFGRARVNLLGLAAASSSGFGKPPFSGQIQPSSVNDRSWQKLSLISTGGNAGTAPRPEFGSSPETRNRWVQISVFSARASASSTSIRSEEHTSELQSLMRISYAVFCLK